MHSIIDQYSKVLISNYVFQLIQFYLMEILNLSVLCSTKDASSITIMDKFVLFISDVEGRLVGFLAILNSSKASAN